jgi:Do/DeqQ family serine protease
MKRFLPIVLVSLLSAVFAVLGYRMLEEPRQVVIQQVVPASFASERESNVPHSTNAGPGDLLTIPTSEGFVKAAFKGTKAVVAIRTLSSNGYWRSDFRSTSSGSGVIIDPQGYIATNNHVIAEGEQIEVTLNDQREFRAEVIGRDPATDLALLKIEAVDLSYLEFGNSDSVFLGEWVLAVGNPFRLQSTVTAGIVSAKGRNIQILNDAAGIEAFIQTDAAVNPGNSGGALLNTDGELIGINTAIITYSGQYEGFSFAIPGNLADKVLADLRNYGSVRRGWLGVTIRPVDNHLADRLGLKRVSGVYLDQVIDDSAADAAGLRAGDVILSVNGTEMTSTPQFMELVGRRHPGDKLIIRYFRNGRERATAVTLSAQRTAAADPAEVPVDLLADIGLEVRNLTPTESSRLRTKGVFVEKVIRGSIVERTNMEPEYIITAINKKPVDSVDELVEEIRKSDQTVLLEGFYERFPGQYPYRFRKD